MTDAGIRNFGNRARKVLSLIQPCYFDTLLLSFPPHPHTRKHINTQIVLHLRSNPSLLDLHDQVTRVLRIIADQMMKEEREGYSLKLYYIAFILQQSHKMEGGTSGCLKMYNACALNS